MIKRLLIKHKNIDDVICRDVKRVFVEVDKDENVLSYVVRVLCSSSSAGSNFVCAGVFSDLDKAFGLREQINDGITSGLERLEV